MTQTVGKDTVVTIDDSYQWPKPMELVLGKKFKLEVWETVLKSMCLKEKSKFIVEKSVSIHKPIFALFRKLHASLFGSR